MKSLNYYRLTVVDNNIADSIGDWRLHAHLIRVILALS